MGDERETTQEHESRLLIDVLKHFCVFAPVSFIYVQREKLIKGIVSRDWGGLQMILLDRYIVVNISAEGYF